MEDMIKILRKFFYPKHVLKYHVRLQDFMIKDYKRWIPHFDTVSKNTKTYLTHQVTITRGLELCYPQVITIRDEKFYYTIVKDTGAIFVAIGDYNLYFADSLKSFIRIQLGKKLYSDTPLEKII